ncbi:uncharacterized protein LOC111699091 isoform X3 [Eurytemora carolleeae]|uniref:uncharacterized protein LOC111699091 isoform X3 n=1 Tax=Eurytemora carolleeae TaxID=1294199 RepID=UPI000C786390|nr:uncharacterized protein LOC111699091 isoform X3 [Eurytemora carolleeae]|eukprot:XP_023325426.1 uncharacterized protein LOC111699091 isoform X3 [Eurytemora affinis]
MRNLLRKIFMKQSGTRNTSDREFIEQLKKEIKGEPSKVEEVTISSDEDIKKEVSADDLEIIEAPHLRRKKKEMNRKRKSRSRSTSSSLESRSELRKEKKTPPTSRSSAQRSNESREKSDTSGQFRSSQPNSGNRYPVPLSQPPPLPVQSPSKPPKKTSRSPGHKSRSRSRSRSRKRSSRSRSRSRSHSRSKKKSRRKSRSPRTRRHGSPRRDTSPHGRRTKSPHGRKDKSPHGQREKSPHGQREKSPHHRRGKSPFNKKREPTPDLFTRRSKERSHDLQKPKTGATQSRVSNEKETKEKVQEKLFASVVGFIDEKTGVLKITSKGKRENQLAIFHKDVLWVMSRNVYTNSMLLEKCVSPCKLETILPMGTGVALTANIIDIPGSIFILQASKVWPALGAAPDEIVSEGELENQLSIFFTTFKLSNYEPLVFDQIETNNLDIWSVKVAECINEDWGMIEIKSYPKIPGRNSVKMFCFFNKSCIWLKNGTAVSQCNAQRLPLSHLVEINQPVNVVARSVINSKGYSMLVQGQEQVHLQALAVSLDPSCIPAGAPRGVLLPDGPGTFGIDIEQHTSYLFDKTLMEKINLELFKFMKESRKTMANIDFNCVPKAKPTEIKTSSKITHVSRLVSSVARIKKQITPEFGVLENFNKTWSAVFRTADCVLDLDKTYAEEFKEGTKVLMNACLVKEKMRAQYMATSVWIIGTPQSMAMLHKDLSADQLHVYNQVNNILDGRDPNIQQEYFDAEQGEVSDHLDSNFGIINFRAEKAMFNLSEVWLSHESTAANRGLELANVLPRGTKVFLHCLMLNSTTEVKYLATAVWKVHPSPFNSANMPQPIRISSLPKEKIEEFRTRLDQFQIHGIPVPDNPTLNTQPSDPEIFIPDLSRPPPVPLFGAPIPQAQHQMIPVAPMELTHGVVKYGLQRKGDRVLTGGLIEFFPPGPPGVRKPSLAIFSVRSLLNHGGSNLCVPDTRVTFLPIPRSGGVESAVTHIGNLVHLTGYMLPPGVNTKMEADGKEILGQMRHRDLLSLFNTDKKILLYGSSDHSFEQLYDTSALMSAVPPSSHRSVRTITDCVGICAGVFNENFGMIQFRLSDQEFRYCLFDTYDLFVEGGARASENGLGISKITKLGDKNVLSCFVGALMLHWFEEH